MFDFCEKMDLFVKDFTEKEGHSGMLRITHKDKVIYKKSIGYADRENKIPFSDDSIFTFYSLSKPFCAMGILKLADKGLVDINAHPGRYIPEAIGFDERVTIKMALHHISGMQDFEQNREFSATHPSGRCEEIRAQLTELSALSQVFEPGMAAMYANINFIVCALVIENVTGMSYSDYMKKEIFDPLGMRNAQIDKEGLFVPNRVHGYEMHDGETARVEKSLKWMLGAGDVIGTVDDVYCLNKAIKNRLILKPETWNAVLTPSTLNGMGMGCSIADKMGKKCVVHNGGHVGFRTLHVQVLEDDFDIIYLSNAAWGDARTAYWEKIFELFYGKNDDGKMLKMDVGYI